ncbi:MAG TPA: hypothetical protein VK524_16595 [Polyangiaceae bacterium]|nr:hypothetical protein [Polyangiaceae bacterium]
MMPRYFRLMFCPSLLALAASCGGSKPIQEEPNAPTGGSPSVPGPQTEDPVSPAPEPEPPSMSEPTEESPGNPPTP